MFCKKCGNQIPTDSEFCTYCGTRLKGAKMEDVIREEDDADGNSYIAVNSPSVEAPIAKEVEETHKENDTVTKEQVPVSPKFETFVENDKAEDKKNGGKNIVFIIIGAMVILALAIIFIKTRGDKKPAQSMSEQTVATEQEVTTTVQKETQAVDQNNGFFEREYSDGSKYKGNFKDGLWDGEGVYTSPNGVVYTGTFTKGAITGKGKINYANGDEYLGDYRNAQRHGVGSLFYKDGSKYSGGFANDKKSGFGEMWMNNGDYFNGSFANGVKKGYGEYYSKNGKSYKGDYKNDVPDGQGQMNYSETEYYRGHFQDGKKNGYGEYHFDNGDVISGNWTSDDITGHFTMFDAKSAKLIQDAYFEKGVRKN